jgi:GT2 family glycosyltransferase
MIKISFVTVCYLTPNLIRQLLRGFDALRLPFQFEYFLVDNAAGDGTGDMVRERFPWVKLIETPCNVGFGAANNLAFRQARGEYIMLMNPDLTVFTGEVEKLIEFADRQTDAGLFGPRLLNPDRTPQQSCHRFPSAMTPLYRRTALGSTAWGKRALEYYLMRGEDLSQAQDVDGLFGSAILIRRRALDEIGFFDERFFMYFEDVDLCRRAWEKGWRVMYAPVAEFVHYHQRESEIKRLWNLFSNPLARTHIMSGAKYFMKYRGKPLPRTLDKTPDLG